MQGGKYHDPRQRTPTVRSISRYGVGKVVDVPDTAAALQIESSCADWHTSSTPAPRALSGLIHTPACFYSHIRRSSTSPPTISLRRRCS
ncbi:hypothetical protein PENSPDRAFT_652040 [Peniophora sp. CONT]|nr:hypothetical protein PENSPDRAFT_652040 [Peniophora sp. CONT]